MIQKELTIKLKNRIRVYNDIIKRLDRVTSGNYMHAVKAIQHTLKCMIDNDKALINEIKD